MKRYLILGGRLGEAEGGLDDMIGHERQLARAKKVGERYEWAEILDSETGMIYRRSKNAGNLWVDAPYYG